MSAYLRKGGFLKRGRLLRGWLTRGKLGGKIVVARSTAGDGSGHRIDPLEVREQKQKLREDKEIFDFIMATIGLY